MNFAVQASQIEAIKDVFIVDFAEVLVPFSAQEPRYPGVTVLGVRASAQVIEVVHRRYV